MSPSARSNETPCTVPWTGKVIRCGRVVRIAPTASAANPPTTRRAEIATTRPHGDSMRARAYLRPWRQRQGRSQGVDNSDEAGAEMTAHMALGDVHLAPALSEDQD